jgi:geranylgeranyl diphosphate synthase type II
MSQLKSTILQEIAPYLLRIEKKIDEAVLNLGPDSKLRQACAYALKNGGKRFRPALVMMIADGLGETSDEVSSGALAVEFFHTASLLADDLPCMDNDDERRGLPSTHKAFNEATALLASYALIAAGYDSIRLSCKSRPELLAPLLENASYNTGILGATGGQFLDLYPGKIDESVIKEVIVKKTGALFELSFVFGFALGGGDMQQMPLVKKCAHHFGAAFQIADDFLDLAQDAKGEQKINAPLILGEEKAGKWLISEIEGFKKTLLELQLNSPGLSAMADALLSSAC